MSNPSPKRWKLKKQSKTRISPENWFFLMLECIEIFFPCHLSLNEKPQMLQNRVAANPFLAKLHFVAFIPLCWDQQLYRHTWIENPAKLGTIISTLLGIQERETTSMTNATEPINSKNVSGKSHKIQISKQAEMLFPVLSPPFLQGWIHPASDKITSITHTATSSGRGSQKSSSSRAEETDFPKRTN